MKNQIKMYDELQLVMQENQNRFKGYPLHYFVSDIMNDLHIESMQEIETSMNRTFDVCDTLQISRQQNFEKIYRSDGKDLCIDWKISSLACYLVIINCNPANECVARAQIHFALHRFGNG